MKAVPFTAVLQQWPIILNLLAGSAPAIGLVAHCCVSPAANFGGTDDEGHHQPER
jgi:hypothetical protein